MTISFFHQYNRKRIMQIKRRKKVTILIKINEVIEIKYELYKKLHKKSSQMHSFDFIY